MVKGVLDGFDASPVILAGLSLGGGIGLKHGAYLPGWSRFLYRLMPGDYLPNCHGIGLTYWYNRSKLNRKPVRLDGQIPLSDPVGT